MIVAANSKLLTVKRDTGGTRGDDGLYVGSFEEVEINGFVRPRDYKDVLNADNGEATSAFTHVLYTSSTLVLADSGGKKCDRVVYGGKEYEVIEFRDEQKIFYVGLKHRRYGLIEVRPPEGGTYG